MSAPRRMILLADVTRWKELRAKAADTDTEARESGLTLDVPILDAIAWLSGFPERDDDQLRQLIEEARDARFSWREIAVAVGESDDRGGETRTQARQAKRNQRFNQRRSG